MRTLAEIFSKSIPPTITLRVPARDVVQEKPKELNQEIVQLKNASKEKPPTNAELLRVPIVEAYPEELQPVNPGKIQLYYFDQ